MSWSSPDASVWASALGQVDGQAIGWPDVEASFEARACPTVRERFPAKLAHNSWTARKTFAAAFLVAAPTARAETGYLVCFTPGRIAPRWATRSPAPSGRSLSRLIALPRRQSWPPAQASQVNAR